MTDEAATDRRLKFFGLNDYGTYYQVERVGEVIAGYEPTSTDLGLSDVIELHNAQLFIESGLFPRTYTESQRTAAQKLIPSIRKTIGRFFATLNDVTFASAVVDLDYDHHDDLLHLLAQHGVYDRVSATAALSTLTANRMGIGMLITSERLVRAYAEEVRDRLMADTVNAELLIRGRLQKDSGPKIYLPHSLTLLDQSQLLNAYIDSSDPNPNFVELVSVAELRADGVVDAKMKLKAQRKHDKLTKKFFERSPGVTASCEVSIADDQEAIEETSMDDLEVRSSYSREWLEDTLDNASVLNNFIYAFGFVDGNMLLGLPSHQAELVVVERFMFTVGNRSYHTGAAFRLKDQASLLQVVMYDRFLNSKDTDLESVTAWFFSDYLKNEFGAERFRFNPSTRTSTYLERCRHIFAEMESVVKQFSLYAENGELDTGLLSIASGQIRYRGIPSFLDGKYVYVTESDEIATIVRLLFSDQSGLTYISEELRGSSAARLIIDNVVSYDDFAAHQKGQIDYLIERGVLKDDGRQIFFANALQFRVLRDIFNCEAASYYHYSVEARVVIDDMVTEGWLRREGSLLTDAESGYFNYFLNQAEFSNGPDLRNKYLHGLQATDASSPEHAQTYFTALRLLIALVIKINDEFCLRDEERSAVPSR